MRKLMSCVLMMTLLLSGCKAGGGGEENPENLAALIRGEYLNLTAWTATVSVTADYGPAGVRFCAGRILGEGWGDGAHRGGAGAGSPVSPPGSRRTEPTWNTTGPACPPALSPGRDGPRWRRCLFDGAAHLRLYGRCVYENWDGSQVLKVECRDPEGAEGAGSECALYLTRTTMACSVRNCPTTEQWCSRRSSLILRKR